MEKITEEEFERRKAIEKAYYIDGKEIEFTVKRENDWYYYQTPCFNWKHYDYRIKEPLIEENKEFIYVDINSFENNIYDTPIDDYKYDIINNQNYFKQEIDKLRKII